MQKINFQDLPNTTTPIDANNLNLLQDNIENDIGDLSELETTAKTDLVSAINEANQHGSGGGGETLPVGAEIEFDGQSTDIPTGWEEITNPDSYSTTEIKTNKTWIDGRPIYRKCINVGTISSIGNYTFNHNIQNIARYTSISAIGNSGNTYYNVPFASNQGMFSGVGFGIRSASLTQIQIYAGATGHSFVAIIEYTKTTD